MNPIPTLIRIHQQLRVFHWLTTSHAQHQALGSTYEALDKIIDEFIEVYLGKYPRPTAAINVVIKLEQPADDNIISLLDIYTTHLSDEFVKELNTVSDTDLLNLRDSILGELNKLKYLLTLS